MLSKNKQINLEHFTVTWSVRIIKLGLKQLVDEKVKKKTRKMTSGMTEETRKKNTDKGRYIKGKSCKSNPS